MLVVGVVIALVGLGLVIGGGVVAWAYGTQRDADGYFSTDMESMQSAGFALVSPDVHLNDSDARDWAPSIGLKTRVDVRSDAEKAVFVGIARTTDVERYLDGARYDVVDSIQHHPYRVQYRPHNGTATPALPAEQTFWVAKASGTGLQGLRWDVENGQWSVVVMNADASPGVIVDAAAGVKTWLVLPLAIGLLGGGFIALFGGLALAVVGARRLASTPPAPTAAPRPASPSPA